MSQTAIPLTDDANAAAIVNDSSWFPFDINLNDGTFEFVQADAAIVAEQYLVSQAAWTPQGLRHRLSIAGTLASWPDLPPTAVNFIWNTGFCSPVLVSRALEKAGANVALREPDVLTRLADMKRARLLDDPRFQRLPRAVFGLLSRPMAARANTLITGSPTSSIMAMEAAQHTTGKMLFLYTDLRSFLINVARDGEIARSFVRRAFSIMGRDGHDQSNWSAVDLFQMTDLQVAALVWHMQMHQFRRSMAALGARAASLDADAFLQSPRTVLEKLDDFFGIDLGSDHAEQTADGPLLRTRDASGRVIADVWDTAEKERRVDENFAKHLDLLVERSYQISKSPLGVPLPNALIPIDKSYHP